MSPLAKFFRTFAAGMVGVLGSVVLFAQASDYQTGLVALTVGTASAALAGLVSAALAAADTLQAKSPVLKGVATFLQFVAAGLATVTIASLTDLANFPHVIAPLAVAGLVAGLQTFFQNSAEAKTA